jgi:hypothetical protein
MTDVNLNLPKLELKPPPAPPPNKEATARVQHIFNDFLKAEHQPPIFHESGDFGENTKQQVILLQEKHGIFPAEGVVGARTWKALLEDWAKLPPVQVQLPAHPVE